MTSDDIRLLGIEGHVETINFIAGLIVDFVRINQFDMEETLQVIEQAARAKEVRP